MISLSILRTVFMEPYGKILFMQSHGTVEANQSCSMPAMRTRGSSASAMLTLTAALWQWMGDAGEIVAMFPLRQTPILQLSETAGMAAGIIAGVLNENIRVEEFQLMSHE